MFYSSDGERRQHKRYFVYGLARFLAPAESRSDGDAEVANVSAGGICLLSKNSLAVGTEIQFVFTVQGYSSAIHAKGRVERSDVSSLGISFLQEPEGIKELVGWLEAQLISSFLT